MPYLSDGGLRVREELELFRDFLKARGHKLTHQRETILRRTLQINEHFSAEQLFELLRSESKGISKATVYRTLALLVEAKLLDALDFDRGFLLYERSTHEAHHDHLICVRCKRIFEFHNEEIEKLQEQIATRYDFEMVSHTHHIYGLCGRCRSEGDGSESTSTSAKKRRVKST